MKLQYYRIEKSRSCCIAVRLVDILVLELIEFRIEVSNSLNVCILFSISGVTLGGCQSDLIYNFLLYVSASMSYSSSPAKAYFNRMSLVNLSIVSSINVLIGLRGWMQNLRPRPSKDPIPSGECNLVQRLW